jgi:hypothetical protein
MNTMEDKKPEQIEYKKCYEDEIDWGYCRSITKNRRCRTYQHHRKSLPNYWSGILD